MRSVRESPPRPDGIALGQELSLRVVLFHEAVASRLGLNATEHKLLSLIARDPGIGPSELVTYTGLSHPAITKAVNKLVGLGYTERRRDSSDRRRFTLYATPLRRQRMAGVLAPMAEAMESLVDGMDEAERRAVTRWVTGTIDVLRRSTAALTETAGNPAPGATPPATGGAAAP
ncbi:MarR family winged helix-turn-helix transcriptional regulator [Streptomyces kebangsaanensis]|uniref:MarR family winged helix-turn-helix transcriptional regulator n=1 Tax=Streptomyces kebangsaanensis TaxID=864058 RepID=A0ABW6KYK2_9ACTN